MTINGTVPHLSPSNQQQIIHQNPKPRGVYGVTFSTEMLQDESLKAPALILYDIVAGLTRSKHGCQLSNNVLGPLIRCEPTHVGRHVKALVAGGYIRVAYGKDNHRKMSLPGFILLTDEIADHTSKRGGSRPGGDRGSRPGGDRGSRPGGEHKNLSTSKKPGPGPGLSVTPSQVPDPPVQHRTSIPVPPCAASRRVPPKGGEGISKQSTRASLEAKPKKKASTNNRFKFNPKEYISDNLKGGGEEAFHAWCDYRTAKGNPFHSAAEVLAFLNSVNSWDKVRFAAAVEYSMGQGYAGLHEKKGGSNGTYEAPKTKQERKTEFFKEMERKYAPRHTEGCVNGHHTDERTFETTCTVISEPDTR